MDNLIYILFISIFVPLFLMMAVIDKKSRLPLIFVLVGILVSLFASEINGLILKYFPIDEYKVSINIAPVTEEILKVLPVLFYAIVISDKKETLFTISIAIGIGFAILENAYILLINYENFFMITGIIRGFGTGLMHGMCTLLVGFGISFVKKKKKLFFIGTFALLATAITYHSIFNMLVQSPYQIVGALLPIATYTPFFIWRNIVKKKSNTNNKLIKEKKTYEEVS